MSTWAARVEASPSSVVSDSSRVPTADRPALLADFYIEASGQRLADYLDPFATPEARQNSRNVRWFPRAVGDYEVQAVAIPVPGATVNI